MWGFICLDLVCGEGSMRRLVEDKVVAVMLGSRCGGNNSGYGGGSDSVLQAITMEVEGFSGAKTYKLIKD
jgi:hypothetical protein